MDLDTFSSCHKAEYIVAEHRVAAACHAIVDAFNILRIDDEDVVAAFFLDQLLRFLLHLRLRSLRLSALLIFEDPFFDVCNVNGSVTDSCVEGIDGLELLLLDDSCSSLVVELHLPVLQAASKQFLSVCCLGKFAFSKLLLDLCPGLVGHDEVQPV